MNRPVSKKPLTKEEVNFLATRVESWVEYGQAYSLSLEETSRLLATVLALQDRLEGVMAKNPEPVQVKRDTFARATLVRKTILKHERGACCWCGQPAKFRYRWESDNVMAGPRSWERADQFCCLDCARAYGAA
jgi:hypothetical protein